MVSSAAPTSTTNITGFLMSVRGLSLENKSQNARLAIFASQIDLPFLIWAVMSSLSSESLARIHQQVFQNRTQAERGEKGQCANDQNYRDQQASEQWSCHRERAQRLRHVFLARQAAGNRQNWNDHEKPAEQHGCADGGVVPE